MTVKVPGNLIFLGEYAVLEEGGLGIVCAVDRHIRLHTLPAQELRVEGVQPSGSFTWTPWSPRGEQGTSVVAAVFDTITEWKRRRGAGDIPGLQAHIDSSELALKKGQKGGFGSSAAAALALVIAFSGQGRLNTGILRLALEAHRLAQGGMGSGYDVYCSFFGGWGMFRGGARPTWKQLQPFADIRFYLFPGPRPVSTRNAIQSFLQWKSRHEERACRLIEESNGHVRDFATADNPAQAALALCKARQTSIMLGDEIGVEARIPVPAGIDPDHCKSLGAGNELGLYMRLPGTQEPHSSSMLTPVSVSLPGAQWSP